MTPREMIEWIQDDVSRFYMTRCRDKPKLVYVTNSGDLAEIREAASVSSRGPSCDGGFSLHTAAGYVEVIADPNCPVGRKPFRAYRCPCGCLFLDDSSRSGKCMLCMIHDGTDRLRIPHPDPSFEHRSKDRRADSLEYDWNAIGGQHAKLVGHMTAAHALAVSGIAIGNLLALWPCEEQAIEQRSTPRPPSIVHRDVKPENVPAPLPCGPERFDGLTGHECMARWSGNRTCVELGQPPVYAMTPVQISEAKRQYLAVAQHTWSRILAAKVAASRERERLTVVNEQEVEDEPWR